MRGGRPEYVNQGRRIGSGAAGGAVRPAGRGVAGGRDKPRAIAAVLQSGLITGLITDEATAREVVALGSAAAAAAGPAVQRRQPQGVLGMHDKERDLMRAFVAGRAGPARAAPRRRQLGLGAAAAGYLLNQAQTEALAADFDWQANKGKTVNLLLNKHPYADAMIADLDDVQAADRHGREVRRLPGGRLLRQGRRRPVLGQRPVRRLHDRRLPDLAATARPAGSSTSTSSSQDPAKTNPNYNWDDVLPNLRASTSWSGVPFAALGGDGAKQWAIPWGFELNSIAYNQRIFDELGDQARRRTCRSWSSRRRRSPRPARASTASACAASRCWATIHPGYLSAFANYGAQRLRRSRTARARPR